MAAVLSPEYVCFSQELPPGSKTIWCILEDDMSRCAPRSGGKQKLLDDLSRFFSVEVVKAVEEHLDSLQGSSLGEEYVIKQPFPAIGKSVIDGIQAGLTTVGNEQCPTSGTSAQAGSSIGGVTGGAGGAGGSVAGDDDPDPKSFSEVEEVSRRKLVNLSRWSTPLRGTVGRRRTIRERSEDFSFTVGPPSGLLYDPRYSTIGTVSLYHGTRSSELPSFALDGIDPVPRKSEFWSGAAFYTSNLIQYAYEFPLHYHLGAGADDHVAVLEFKVNAGVINGTVPPSADEDAFKVKWFRSPDAKWEQWIAWNMLDRSVRQRLGLKKEDVGKPWDIVIGPVCFGGPSDAGRVEPVRLNSEGVHLTQVAFCSPRSQKWLQSKFSQVFVESRSI